MARPKDPNAKSALVEAARGAFAKVGIQNARIEDVTRAAGLSKGAFYLHFESKEALFAELVGDFSARMTELQGARMERNKGFFAGGPLTLSDCRNRSPRYARYLELEVEDDYATLELMWDHRDVVDVLLHGVGGTRFQTLLWDLVDVEVERVGENFRELQTQGSIRNDVPHDLFGSFLVGAYLLVAARMIRMKEKPDLRAWALNLQRVLREGCAPPVHAPPRRAAAVAARGDAKNASKRTRR